MDRYAVFTLLWTLIAQPVDAAAGLMVGGLTGWIGPKFKLCVLAYFIVSMLIASWSSDEQAFLRYFRQIFLASVIFSLAANADTFNYYVGGIAKGFVNGISTAIAGAFNQGQPVNADAFDILAARAYAVGLAVYKNLPMMSLKIIPLGISIIVYWLLSLAAILMMYCVYLISYVAMAFLIAIGPLFVAFFFFPFTRRWFDGWLRNLATAVLVQIFTAALGTMFIMTLTTILLRAADGLIGSQAGQVDGGVVVGELMMLDVTAAVCIIFALLEGYIVYLAMNIAGGAHAQFSAMQTPSWASFTGSSSSAPAATHSGGHSAAGGSISHSPQGGGSVEPIRQYSFNRTVGSAP